MKCRFNITQNILVEIRNENLLEYDGSMVRKYIELIKVYDDKLTVCFKAKVEIEVER